MSEYKTPEIGQLGLSVDGGDVVIEFGRVDGGISRFQFAPMEARRLALSLVQAIRIAEETHGRPFQIPASQRVH